VRSGPWVSSNLAPATGNTISSDTAPFTSTDIGHAIEILNTPSGGGTGQADFLRITAVSPDHKTATLDRSITLSATATFVVHHRATAATATTITDSGASWTVNQFAGAKVRTLDSTAGFDAIYQESVIVSNTSDTLTISATWDATPDTSCAFEIVDGVFQIAGAAFVTDDFKNISPFAPTIDVPNSDAIIEYVARGADASGAESPYYASQVARLAVTQTGLNATKTALQMTPASLRLQSTAGLYANDESTGDLYRIFVLNGNLTAEKI
jgi:hypothetical protein